MDKVSDTPQINNPPPDISNQTTNPIKPKKLITNPIFIGILVFIIIISVLGSILLLQGKLSFSLLPFIERPLPLPSPTPISENIPNVLFPHSPDPSGRNIYYFAEDLGNPNIKYSGVGVQTFPAGIKFTDEKGKTLLTTSSSSAMTNYIVGSFDRFEKIPNSKDMYIILTDLLGVRNQKGEAIPLPKVRIGFSTEKVDEQTNILGTAFGVEDLNSVIPKVIDKNAGIKLYKIGLIGAVSTQDLETLIKPGDAMAITIVHDFTSQKDFLDQNKNIVAAWLFIRRFDPKTALPKELNKPIDLI